MAIEWKSLGLPQPYRHDTLETTIGDGKAELYVRLHFSRMQRGIEHSELHRAFLEHGMKVQRVVPACVIMHLSLIHI